MLGITENQIGGIDGGGGVVFKKQSLCLLGAKGFFFLPWFQATKLSSQFGYHPELEI